jgi:hypothetical protein
MNIRSVTEGMTAVTAADLTPKADLREQLLERSSAEQLPTRLAVRCEHAACGGRRLVQCIACVKLVTKAHAIKQAKKGQPLAKCSVHGKNKQKGLPALMELIKDAGYTGLFLLEYEIATRGKSVGQRVLGQAKAQGADSRQRFDLVLPGVCAFEVHGPGHTQKTPRNPAYRSDAQKISNAEHEGIPLAVLRCTDRTSWSSTVRSMLVGHASDCSGM